MTKRIITIEVEIPGGDPDFTHFALTANPFEVAEYGVLVCDEVVQEVASGPEILSEV